MIIKQSYFQIFSFSALMAIQNCHTSCHPMPASNNYTYKITSADLDKVSPVIVRKNGINTTTYHVIIFTTQPELLKKSGILIQSISKKFVTALIQKEDIEKIYHTEGVEQIKIPDMEYSNQTSL